MKKRRTAKKVHRKRFISGVNPAIVAFIGAFLATITVGAVFLGFAVGNGNLRDLKQRRSSDDVAVSTTRVPFAEKVLSQSENLVEATREELSAGDDLGAEISGSDAEDTGAQENDMAGETAPTAESSYWERSLTSKDSENITLAFAGDILFDPGYAIMGRIKQNGGGIDGVIGAGLLDYMRGTDIMVVNNEFPYSYGGSPTEGKTFTFRAEPASASLLVQMGVDVATVANNHIYDYGPQALMDTLSAIDGVGVARAGAGSDINEASHPLYFTNQDGLRVAIIAATQIERLDNPDTKGATDSSPGVFRCLDITRLQQKIREAKDTGAFVIVCIHWGTENREDIDWWQEKQGPEIVEAGADLIVGAHPHILQKIGYIGDVPVVYSLGNFLFNSKTLDTGLLRVTVGKDFVPSLQFVPAIQEGSTVREAMGGEGQSVLGHLRDISDGITIDENGYITKR